MIVCHQDARSWAILWWEQGKRGTRPIFLRPWYELRVTIKIYQSALEASQTAILSFFGKKCCQWISQGKILQDTPLSFFHNQSLFPGEEKNTFSPIRTTFLQQTMM